MPTHYNVLFLCTGNSARSIMAEAVMNHMAGERFTAYSAGSFPSGKVRPEALAQLRDAGVPVYGLRSKSWEEFATPDAPMIDFILTVCDNAAKEVCPMWPGRPITAHWGVSDPAAVSGPPHEIDSAYRSAFRTLERRIGLLLSLHLDQMDRLEIERKMDEIGHE